MRPNDKPQFFALLTSIAEYYRQPVHDDVSALYWHVLKDLPMEALKQAFISHLQDPTSGKWMPKAADILKQLQGKVSQRARLAWEKVEAAISRIGRYNDVAFDDPIIHVALKKMGGWSRLCDSLRDELPIYRKQFEQLYLEAHQDNLSPNDYPRYLPGELSKSGANPVLIGDQDC